MQSFRHNQLADLHLLPEVPLRPVVEQDLGVLAMASSLSPRTLRALSNHAIQVARCCSPRSVHSYGLLVPRHQLSQPIRSCGDRLELQGVLTRAYIVRAY